MMITNHDLLDNLRGQVYHLQQKLIEAQDYIAAEKSACEELHKREVEYQQEIADLKVRLEKAEAERDSHEKARRDDRDRLQQKCSDWGTYWRASDAHGVNLNIGQAIELLQDALGVEVDIHTGLDAAIARAEKAEASPLLQIEREEKRKAISLYHELKTDFDVVVNNMQARIDAAIRERDEARADVERLRMSLDGAWTVIRNSGAKSASIHDAINEVVCRDGACIARLVGLLKEVRPKIGLSSELSKRIDAEIGERP